MVETIARQKVAGKVSSVLRASGNGFVSQAVETIELDYGGIVEDYHHGATRKSGAREPWYDTGIEMRNERQISILSGVELAEIAKNMELDEINPGWIGGNLVIDGIENLSLLPPRTVLIFEGGVTLRVDGYNGPCRIAGGAIAEHLATPAQRESANYDPTRSEIALQFSPAARLKRGLVAWVEREGSISPGEQVVGHVWEQWLYQ